MAAHERELQEAMRRFYELSPEEQMRAQLKNWERIITMDVNQ